MAIIGAPVSGPNSMAAAFSSACLAVLKQRDTHVLDSHLLDK
jgi:hypothetical protein